MTFQPKFGVGEDVGLIPTLPRAVGVVERRYKTKTTFVYLVRFRLASVPLLVEESALVAKPVGIAPMSNALAAMVESQPVSTSAAIGDRKQDRVEKLETAIRDVVTQQLDNICWLDVFQRLAALVDVKFDPLLMPKEQLLKNCERFACSIYAGKQYIPDKVTSALQDLADAKRAFGIMFGFDLSTDPPMLLMVRVVMRHQQLLSELAMGV